MEQPTFRTLIEVAEQSESQGREVLSELYGANPVLIVKASGSDGGAVLVMTSGEGFPTDAWKEPEAEASKTEAGKLQSPFLALAEGGSLVVPVVKTDLNPFAGMIIVGRAGNNDIRFASSNVSKVHAFLKQQSDSWFVEDRSSTNGTVVNGVTLEATVDHQLNFGDELRFGDVPCMFMDVERLFALCGLVLRSTRDGS